jgi:hypothetical protein
MNELGKDTDPETFRQYYYLKEQLTAFCRENGLRISGGKPELTERVYGYLLTGERAAWERTPRPRTVAAEIRPDTAIGPDLLLSQTVRAFFEEHIGTSFTFCLGFNRWLRDNPERTFGDAVNAYREIKEAGRHQRTVIGRQFEYNTYIRDFFADNPGRTLKDAIVCWKHKKALPGSNRYDRSDLEVFL